MTIHHFEVLESTQDLAHQLAAEGAEAGTAVVAVEQQAGRGTRGRGWSSARGGLWLTVILRPSTAGAVEGLSLRVGLEVAHCLERVAASPVPIRIKWPNDLMADDRKLGGILCEARWLGDAPGWIAVGIGINLTNQVPAELRASAVALAELGGQAEATDLVTPVVAAVVQAGERAGPLTEAELAEFASRDWLRGRALVEPVVGRAAGVTADARLIVEQPTGARTAVLGSVTLAALARDGGSR